MQPIYVVNMGAVTPVGSDSPSMVAAVNANINVYEVSPDFSNGQGESITMTGLPEEFYFNFEEQFDQGEVFYEHCDRLIKMAVTALRETCENLDSLEAIPLVLALPEPVANVKSLEADILIKNLIQYAGVPLDREKIYRLHTGRAAGIQALELAHRYLYELGHNYVLVGGCESYWNASLLDHLDHHQRLLAPNALEGFAPGEAAAFLLLSRDPQLTHNGDKDQVVLHSPGLAQEPGHLYNEEPYQGEGLNQAFKQALKNTNHRIDIIYSSMNGEGFWAKEFGVATLRNRSRLAEEIEHCHPADCYGELGAATGPVLLILAIQRLLENKNQRTALVYASSDTALRAAVCIEKISSPTQRV